MSQKENSINYIITDTQTRAIAYCVFSDIADYIQKNEAKYKKWLSENNLKEESQ